MNFRLRTASLADLEALAALEHAIFSDPWSAAQLRAALSWAEVIALIAEDEAGAIAGYLIGRFVVDQAEILTLATAPEQRRKGVARELLAAATAAMVARHVTSIWLEVRTSNAAARALYAAEGFVTTGVRHGYYRQPPEDALVLRRELAASAGSVLR